MGEYFVYILASKRGVLYIGITNDLLRRAAKHRKGVTPGFTSRYRVRRLVYFEAYSAAGQAINREKQLKGWTRERKLKLVSKTNPLLADLYPQLVKEK
jgi:putative endonuclease